jgi:hypothetical protein
MKSRLRFPFACQANKKRKVAITPGYDNHLLDLGCRPVHLEWITSRLPPYSGTFQTFYFPCSLLSASFTAVSSASAAFTFTSGSTPVSAQSVFEKGLIGLVSGIPIPK